VNPEAIHTELGRVVVIIPTYNERKNLPLIVGRVREATPQVDILVVDDGSPDGTGELADEMAADDSQVKVLHRSEKSGLGGAYIAGFRWAADNGYDVMVEMDADGSHQPEELPRLLAALADGADLVIGARWVPGGKVENWPKSREVLSRSANIYARLMLGFHLRDSTGGYRAFRRTALEKIGLEGVESRGYGFQVDMAFRAVRAGLTAVEVPITFVERVHGVSKMSRDIIVEAMMMVTRWGLKRRFGRS
jgi:dolichol-phosphate mannosyltransferase